MNYGPKNDFCAKIIVQQLHNMVAGIAELLLTKVHNMKSPLKHSDCVFRFFFSAIWFYSFYHSRLFHIETKL